MLVVAFLAIEIAQVHVDVGVPYFVLALHNFPRLLEVRLCFLQVISLQAESPELVMLDGDEQILMLRVRD